VSVASITAHHRWRELCRLRFWRALIGVMSSVPWLRGTMVASVGRPLDDHPHNPRRETTCNDTTHSLGGQMFKDRPWRRWQQPVFRELSLERHEYFSFFRMLVHSFQSEMMEARNFKRKSVSFFFFFLLNFVSALLWDGSAVLAWYG